MRARFPLVAEMRFSVTTSFHRLLPHDIHQQTLQRYYTGRAEQINTPIVQVGLQLTKIHVLDRYAYGLSLFGGNAGGNRKTLPTRTRITDTGHWLSM